MDKKEMESGAGDVSTGLSGADVTPRSNFNPWFFFSVLVAPCVLTLITLFNGGTRNYGEPALLVLLISSVICGIICGIYAIRLQKHLSTGVRWVLGIATLIGCIGAAFAIGTAGCFVSIEAIGVN